MPVMERNEACGGERDSALSSSGESAESGVYM